MWHLACLYAMEKWILLVLQEISNCKIFTHFVELTSYSESAQNSRPNPFLLFKSLNLISKPRLNWKRDPRQAMANRKWAVFLSQMFNESVAGLGAV